MMRGKLKKATIMKTKRILRIITTTRPITDINKMIKIIPSKNSFPKFKLNNK